MTLSPTPPAPAKAPAPKPKIYNFIIGGLSGMIATCCIQPIDMIKVRIQLRGQEGSKDLSPFSVARHILKNEGGILSFYKGLDSALMRQAVYTTLRLGIFFTLNDMMKERKGGAALTTLEKIACSFTAGGLGSFCGTPFDLCLVRMQSDATLPVEQRRNYSNIFNALFRIPRQEGIKSLWKGGVPTVTRAIALNIGMLVSFEDAKERLSSILGKGTKSTVLTASAISGIFTALFSLPFDNIKTKLQKMKELPDGTKPYAGVFDCLQKTLRSQGVTGLYAGLPTYYFRVAPHAMITLVASEFLKKLVGM